MGNTIGTVLNPMFPFKMLLRSYSLCILIVDVMWVVVNTNYAILQAVYGFFNPPPLKSLHSETALVSVIFLN